MLEPACTGGVERATAPAHRVFLTPRTEPTRDLSVAGTMFGRCVRREARGAFMAPIGPRGAESSAVRSRSVPLRPVRLPRLGRPTSTRADRSPRAHPVARTGLRASARPSVHHANEPRLQQCSGDLSAQQAQATRDEVLMRFPLAGSGSRGASGDLRSCRRGGGTRSRSTRRSPARRPRRAGGGR